MKKNKYVTKLNLYIRILVAGYVVYLAYQLLPSIQGATGTEKIWMMIAAAILGLAGLVIVGLSVKGLICKEYYEASEIEEMQEAEQKKNETVVDAETIEAADAELTSNSETNEKTESDETI